MMAASPFFLPHTLYNEYYYKIKVEGIATVAMKVYTIRNAAAATATRGPVPEAPPS